MKDSGILSENIKVEVRIDDNTLNAVREVVRYLWEEEQRDYAECIVDGNEAQDHIFKKLITIARSLDKDSKEFQLDKDLFEEEV